MNTCGERLKNGIIDENPIFVLLLGMCPTLAVTTSAMNGIGMGLSTTFVLVMSNMLISMLRKIIPDSVRMPAFIVVVASFVTIVDFMMEGFTPDLYDSLGLYIPLIVVNCIILGRAESYASKILSFRPFLMDLEWDLDSQLPLLLSVLCGKSSEQDRLLAIRSSLWQMRRQEQQDTHRSRSLSWRLGHSLY